MTREFTLLALLLTPLALGCSEDGAPGGDDAGDDTASSSAGPATSGASAESGSTTNSTGDADSGDSGEAEASSSSGDLDPCGDCIANSCSDQTAACAEDEACGCWLGCIDAVDDPSECVAECGDAPSTLEEVFACVAEACADPCEL
ncbi:MAG: hypothetical protein K0V04_39585 [Deltaproteobacteria bacterium]|nr:hypothetical protein [Deltaproteobacteria bacterium]